MLGVRVFREVVRDSSTQALTRKLPRFVCSQWVRNQILIQSEGDPQRLVQFGNLRVRERAYKLSEFSFPETR
jgi:hypothetical protein